MGGTGFSNSYRTTYNLDPRLAYYFTEALGIEAFFTLTANSANNTFEALVGTNTNVKPVIREIRTQMGLLGHWVPWYAKINVFNKILYFDWYFSGGAGQMRTQVSNNNVTNLPQDLFALYLGTGHQYHLGDRFLVRLDFTAAIYRAQVFGDRGDSAWYSNYNAGIGLGLKL
jgi:outer membrane beta-barrel protein